MKPIVISSCLALAALSLYAADPQATNATPTQHSETLLSSKQAVGIGDSPLVRAAKATNRLNKKPGQVITNETLIRAGGHFTTTTAAAQAQLPAPPAAAATPTMDQMAAEQRRARTASAATAARAAKVQEQKRLAAAQAAARAEGDTPEALYNDPPALEGPIPTVKPMTPETFGQPQTTTQPQKPPK
jgi:hypothetical protein